MKYSLDANSCIEAWREFYPYSVFPKVWDHWLTAMFKKHDLEVSRSVYEELEVGGDDLFYWFKQNSSFSPAEDDENVQIIVTAIQTDWPNKNTDFQRRLRGADLFVIGHAIYGKGAVVSHEQKSGNLRDPKIPDACGHLGVECIHIAEMFRREGFSF